MRISRRVWLGAALLAVAAAGYWAGRARADGVPPQNALTYSGVAVSDGVPLSGPHRIAVGLWDDLASTDTAHRKCVTEAEALSVQADGRFSLPLDEPCTAAVHAGAVLYAQVDVDGTTLGRARLSAVPYALEADRASNSAGALEQRLKVLESQQASGMPTGAVSAFFGAAAPDGWLVCDGATINKATTPRYAALVDLLRGLGAAFQGPPASEALLPDLRGMFLRGQDRSRGANPDPGADTIGRLQADQLQAHTHADSGHTHADKFSTFDSTGSQIGNKVVTAGGAQALFADSGAGGSGQAQLGEPTTSSAGAPRFGGETRPKNVTVLYLIKY